MRMPGCGTLPQVVERLAATPAALSRPGCGTIAGWQTLMTPIDHSTSVKHATVTMLQAGKWSRPSHPPLAGRFLIGSLRSKSPVSDPAVPR
jgi:hypothetical protein